ncbi:pyridoxal-dependent decarboxylase, exosortase A system-associated [Sphingomicrobium sediminis]
MGSIPAGYGADERGALVVAEHPVGYWMEKAGSSPIFLYDTERVAAQVESFRRLMPDRLALHYAVKANPFGPLLDFIAPLVDGFDLASRGEIARVSHLDLPKSLAGPGKSDKDLEAALSAGVTIHVESESEAERACLAGRRLGIQPKMAVRINPPFMLKGAGMKMGGLASQFGMDAPLVAPLVKRIFEHECEWRGFHIYAGSQSLSESAILEAQRETLKLVAELTAEIGTPPPEVNLGGGFGIPYYSGEKPLDLAPIGEGLDAALGELSGDFADTQFVIELGRWLVGEAGIYLTRILDRKVSQGETYLVTDGGLQHMLAASGNFGQFLRRNYPIKLAERFAEEGDSAAHVVGRLCTPLDLLGDAVPMPADAKVGETIAIFCAGAYGLTASPQEFLSQPAAVEMLAQSSG